jgi:hypothetical protein
MTRTILSLTLVAAAFGFLGASAANGQEKNLEQLIKQLRNRATADRPRIAEELGKLGEGAKPAARALCEGITESSTSKLHTACLEALEKVWPELYKLVVTILRDKSEIAKAEAIKTVQTYGDDGIAAVPVMLDNLKRQAAVRWSTFGEDRPRTEFMNSETFRKYGGYPTPSIVATIEAMKKLDPKNADYVKIMLAASSVTNKAQANRALAIEALGDLAEDNAGHQRQIKQSLVAALADTRLRAVAIRSLGKLGPNAKDQLATLKKLKFDPLEEVRQAATEAIERIQK